jgi:hypothetical protein
MFDKKFLILVVVVSVLTGVVMLPRFASEHPTTEASELAVSEADFKEAHSASANHLIVKGNHPNPLYNEYVEKHLSEFKQHTLKISCMTDISVMQDSEIPNVYRSESNISFYKEDEPSAKYYKTLTFEWRLGALITYDGRIGYSGLIIDDVTPFNCEV